MSIFAIVFVLIVIGVGLYLVGLIPMDPKILTVIRVVVILAVVLWILDIFFDLESIGHLHRVRR